MREDGGSYARARPASATDIPASLHDSLMARLDRLASAKSVAQFAAMLGRQFSYELLHAVAPFDKRGLNEALAQLVDAELVYQRGVPPDATYSFKHALIHDAAYQSLLKSTRQQYHAAHRRGADRTLPGAGGYPARAGRAPLHRGWARRAGDQLLVHGRPARRRVLGQPGGDQLPRQGPRSARRRTAERANGRTSSSRCRRCSASPSCRARATARRRSSRPFGARASSARSSARRPSRSRCCAACGPSPSCAAGSTRRASWPISCSTSRAKSDDDAFLVEAYYALGCTLLYLGEPRASCAWSERGIALYDPAAPPLAHPALRRGPRRHLPLLRGRRPLATRPSRPGAGAHPRGARAAPRRPSSR